MDWPLEETRALEWIEEWVEELKFIEGRREAGKREAAAHFNVAPVHTQQPGPPTLGRR